jgi:hypothetical protein
VKHPIVNGIVLLGAAVALVAGFGVLAVLGAALVGWLILRVGVLMLGGLARPVPEAPPAGELRKVKIAYRCEICGTEVRMTVAPDVEPEPPRHCQDDMTLVSPVE